MGEERHDANIHFCDFFFFLNLYIFFDGSLKKIRDVNKVELLETCKSWIFFF